MRLRTLSLGVFAVVAGAATAVAAPFAVSSVNTWLDLAVAGWLQTLLQIATSVGSAVGVVIYINREIRDVRAEQQKADRDISEKLGDMSRDLGRVEGTLSSVLPLLCRPSAVPPPPPPSPPSPPPL